MIAEAKGDRAGIACLFLESCATNIKYFTHCNRVEYAV